MGVKTSNLWAMQTSTSLCPGAVAIVEGHQYVTTRSPAPVSGRAVRIPTFFVASTMSLRRDLSTRPRRFRSRRDRSYWPYRRKLMPSRRPVPQLVRQLFSTCGAPMLVFEPSVKVIVPRARRETRRPVVPEACTGIRFPDYLPRILQGCDLLLLHPWPRDHGGIGRDIPTHLHISRSGSIPSLGPQPSC